FFYPPVILCVLHSVPTRRSSDLFWLSQKLKRIIRNRLIKRNVDPSIREFIIPIFDFLFKLLVVLSAISTLGVHTTSFAAIIAGLDRKSTRLNSSHVKISYAVFCL